MDSGRIIACFFLQNTIRFIRVIIVVTFNGIGDDLLGIVCAANRIAGRL